MIIKISYSGIEKLQNIEKELIIIDVREEGEYLTAHLNCAVNIPFHNLAQVSENWDRTKPLLVYCLYGKRSLRGAEILERAGFKKVYYVQGGIKSP
jgi:rhodanese-related sulfurtransferase